MPGSRPDPPRPRSFRLPRLPPGPMPRRNDRPPARHGSHTHFAQALVCHMVEVRLCGFFIRVLVSLPNTILQVALLYCCKTSLSVYGPLPAYADDAVFAQCAAGTVLQHHFFLATDGSYGDRRAMAEPQLHRGKYENSQRMVRRANLI